VLQGLFLPNESARTFLPLQAELVSGIRVLRLLLGSANLLCNGGKAA
jgi:hypothetical protein